MQAFHNDPAVKEKYLSRVIAHQKADHLIRGQGWTGTRGCAVGCTLEAYDHSRYPKELGIPEWLARVEDTLFEGMALEKSRTWPELFLEAIPIGVDLEQVKTGYLTSVLESCLRSLDSLKVDPEKDPQTDRVVKGSRASVVQVMAALKSGDAGELRAGWSAAAEAAAAAGRWSAAEAAAAAGRWSAAAAAAAAGRWSAEAEAAAAAAAVYDRLADDLLVLLRACK